MRQTLSLGLATALMAACGAGGAGPAAGGGGGADVAGGDGAAGDPQDSGGEGDEAPDDSSGGDAGDQAVSPGSDAGGGDPGAGAAGGDEEDPGEGEGEADDGDGGGLAPPEDPPPRERAPDCAYPPEAARQIAMNQVVPRLAWDRAFTGEGDIFSFDLLDVYCDPSWDRYKIVIFVIGTTWCPYCPSYMQSVHAISEQLDEWGAKVVLVEAQDNGGRPISSRNAYIYLQRLLGVGSDIRVGDGDTRPSPALLAKAEFLTGFPTSFVVRTRDMRVITHQGLMRGGLLPFMAIAQSPDADWSDPGSAPSLPSVCEEGDQEEYEPNDTPWQSADLDGPLEFDGGVCSKPDADGDGLEQEDQDYFDIPAGRWRITVEHDAEMGNLDLFLWDKTTDKPLLDPEGGPVGSATLDDVESFEHDSARGFTVAVLGFFGSTGPYHLTLERL